MERLRIFLGLIGWFLLYIFSDHKEEDELIEKEKKIFQKKKARYYQIRYCEKCHIIFDLQGNRENASHEGFEKILTL